MPLVGNIGTGNPLATTNAYAGRRGGGGVPGGLQGFGDWANQPFDFEQFMGQLEGFAPGAFGALTGAAGGEYLTGNPYLDQTFQQASGAVTDQFNQQVLPNIAAQFGSAGRTGGGLHQGAVSQSAGQLTDSLAGLSNQIYGGNYQLERDRQLGAAQGLFDIYNQGANRNLQGLGLAGDLWSGQQGRATQAGIAAGNQATTRYGIDTSDAFNRLRQAQGNAMDAAGLGVDIYGMQLGQQNNMAGLALDYLNMGQGSDMNQIYSMLQAGGLTEGYGQNQLDAQMDRWNFNQQAPWANLGNYADLIGGGYGTSGTIDTTGTTRGTTTERGRGGMFESLLGAGLMAAPFFFPPAAPFAAGIGASGSLGG